MKTLHHIRRLLLGLGIVALAGLSACGGGAGGGAAPTGDGGGSGVIMEIPAVNELMYVTSPVGEGLSVSSSVSAMSKSIGINDAFTGDSYNACETRNITQRLLADESHTDLEICFMNSYLSSLSADGQYHNIAIWVKIPQNPDASEAVVRYVMTRNTDNVITEFKMYVCSNGSQVEYTKQTTASSGAVTIASKSIDGGDHYRTIGVTSSGYSNDQYTGDKTITHVSRYLDADNNTNSQSLTMTQSAESAIVNGSEYNSNPQFGGAGVSSAFGLLYGGNLTDPLDPRLYSMTNGVGHVIGGAVDQTECWDTNGNVVDINDNSNDDICDDYLAMIGTPPEPAEVSAFTFDGEENISSTFENTNLGCADITDAVSLNSSTDALDISTGTCSNFLMDEDRIDCYGQLIGESQ